MSESLWRGKTGEADPIRSGSSILIDWDEALSLPAPPGTEVVVITAEHYEALTAVAKDAAAFLAALGEDDPAAQMHPHLCNWRWGLHLCDEPRNHPPEVTHRCRCKMTTSVTI